MDRQIEYGGLTLGYFLSIRCGYAIVAVCEELDSISSEIRINKPPERI